MRLAPFPAASRLRWRRLDVPGLEEASVERVPAGWQLTGDVQVEEGGVAARLRYAIECDDGWRTRLAAIEGEAGGSPIRFALAADAFGTWTRDGIAVPELAGAIDVDLGFTPATNTLPIRRLDLAVGQRATVRSAWLRFPELRLEPLEQAYTREADLTYRYEAVVDGEPFVARLETDAFGRVVGYEGLWMAELTVPEVRVIGSSDLGRRVLLRSASASDVGAIQRVRQSVLENRLVSATIPDDDVRDALEQTGRGWVVESDGEIVGFAIGNASDGNVWALFVHPAHERRGYGRALHDTMVEWLRAQGLRRLWLTTEPGTRAQRFYERAGWRSAGSTRHGELRYELSAEWGDPEKGNPEKA